MSETIAISNHGSRLVRSPLRLDALGSIESTFILDEMRYHDPLGLGDTAQFFERAGPREQIFFEPAKSKVAIVTCGGLCPGMNNVLRSVYLQLHYHYGVPAVLGIRYGYSGFSPDAPRPPLWLNAEIVKSIHQFGGTLLGTSRGPVSADIIVDFLEQRGINILFTVGGDGTQRGAHDIAEEIRRRKLQISVVGIPKTIDDDVRYVNRSFGYFTAIEKAKEVIDSAHVEAHCVHNGISIVKVMGRDSGFIAAGATVASQEVNFTLVPEVPFKLEGEHGLLAVLHRRLLERHHAVIVVAEGAGQNLLPPSQERDASGNLHPSRHRPLSPPQDPRPLRGPALSRRHSLPRSQLLHSQRARVAPSIPCFAIRLPGTPSMPPWPARPTSSSGCNTASSFTCLSPWRPPSVSVFPARSGPR